MVSKQLAEGMGGSLTVESELNVGTCFTLAIPARAKADSFSPTISPITISPCRDIRTPSPAKRTTLTRRRSNPGYCKDSELVHVLIADDNQVNLKLLRRQLRIMGFRRVTTVTHSMQ